MPVNSVSELRKTGLSELDYTQYLLSGLKEDQLEAVQAVIIALLKKDGENRRNRSCTFPAAIRRPASGTD